MKLSLSHVRLIAPNVRECFLFYRDTLGLEVFFGNEDTPYAEFKTGDINIVLEPPIGSEPFEALRKPKVFSPNGQVAIIFKVDDVDTVYDQLKSRNIEFVKEPLDLPILGIRVAYLHDPAGNLIEINQVI